MSPSEKENFQRLLKKYVRNESTEIELEELFNYIKLQNHPNDILDVTEVLKNVKEFPEMDPEGRDRILKSILQTPQIKVTARNPKRNYWKYAVAAIFIGLFVWNNSSDKLLVLPVSESTPLQIPDEKIIFTQSNGVISLIDDSTDRTLYNDKGEKVGEITGKFFKDVSVGKDSQVKVTAYNSVYVPYGKTFELVLFDGTRVLLNAGSTLVFPSSIVDEKRQVYLDGEAYFDVVHNATNPFIVKANDLNIKVYGTSFNVSNYGEDIYSDVVLVEGSVGMYSGNPSNEIRLSPGEKGSFSKKDRIIDKRVVPTTLYTSWINGELVFRNATFESIVKKLERHYNVKINNQKASLAEITFNANFRKEPLEKVLAYLNRIYEIEYTINGNEIIIF